MASSETKDDARERSAFLAESSALLASSLDYETTLGNIASLAVPRIADWCAIELGTPGNSTQVASAHVNPAKIDLTLQIRKEFPQDPGSPAGLPHVIRTGKPVLFSNVTDAMLTLRARSPRHLELLRELAVVSVMLVPVRARGRTLGGIAFIATSDSGRRFVAADLEMAEQLGGLAGLAIDNARLYEAEREAREEALTAVRLRDDFLAIAGHELKTPLTALMLQVEAIIRDRGANSAQAARLLRNTARLTKLVDELLDISRIARGGLMLEPEAVDLGALVHEVITRTADEIRGEASRVEVHAPGGIRGDWDRSRLEQVVVNLLSNALKYGMGRPIEIRVDGDQETATLCVRDQGIGIAPEDRDRIFGRFERAVSSRHFGGLGLGLWITREIVQTHGGRIAVFSNLGQGTEFRITLPRSPPRDVPDRVTGDPAKH